MKFLLAIPALLFAAFGYYVFFLNHVTPPLIGVAYNSYSGTITIQDHPGWYKTPFLVSVHYVDPRPVQVCLSVGSRVLNCKQVAFRIEGIKRFIETQGFDDWGYMGTNRPCMIGDNLREGSGCSGMTKILAGYAFADQKEPFYQVLEETRPATVQP